MSNLSNSEARNDVLNRLRRAEGQIRGIQRMVEEGASFGRLLGEPAAREAFAAFLQKRRPVFSKI